MIESLWLPTRHLLLTNSLLLPALAQLELQSTFCGPIQARPHWDSGAASPVKIFSSRTTLLTILLKSGARTYQICFK
ncbi:hypothetical protein C8R46DRAFT_348069 [Mycena filopes]|nr:hypothetical protein C8R46DRAFT_348069 [Mycena filopes]